MMERELLKMFAYLIDKNEELQLFFKGMTMTSFEFTYFIIPILWICFNNKYYYIIFHSAIALNGFYWYYKKILIGTIIIIFIL